MLAVNGILEDVTYIYVLAKGAQLIYKVEYSQSQLETDVMALREGIEIDLEDGLQPFDTKLAHSMYKSLLAPAKDILVDVNHIFFIPNRPLESLPINILVMSEPGNLAYSDVNWFVNRYATSTLPSVRSLSALRGVAKKCIGSQTIYRVWRSGFNWYS